MGTKWREMTLAEAYPYWVLGEIPRDEIPFIACNDMLAGNMDDEIVAVAALSQPDSWELDPVLGRTFARLGLPSLTEREAARLVVLDKMRAIAAGIVSGDEAPLAGANAIYWCASEADLFDEDEGVDQRAADYGADFLQLADALEARQDYPGERRQFEELIVEAAGALLAGRPAPAWHVDADWSLHREGEGARDDE